VFSVARVSFSVNIMLFNSTEDNFVNSVVVQKPTGPTRSLIFTLQLTTQIQMV